MNLFSPLANRRWKSTLGIAGLVLGALLWFAPSLLVHSPLWPWILARATKDMGAQLQTGSASLGWLSPVRVNDLALLDAAGATVITCESIETEKSLWGLLRDRSRLGTIRITAPRVNVAFEESSSNVEQLLAPLLAGPSSSTPPPSGRLEILSGRIDLADTVTGQKSTIGDIDAELYLPDSEADGTWGCNLERCNVVATGTTGSCQLVARWSSTGAASKDSATNGIVSVKTSQLDLSILRPVLRRREPQLQLAGLVSSNLQAKWNSSRPEATAFIHKLAVESLDVVAPAWLGQDRLQVQQLAVAGQCRLAGDQLQLEQLEFKSDLADAVVRGNWNWQNSSPGTSQAFQWLDTLLGGSFTAEGSVDVARLATTLPHTLRIRPDTRIVSGKVALHLRNQPHENGRLWSGQLDTSDLSAVRNGQPMVWKQPLQLRLQVVQSPKQLAIKQLQCRSSFLNLSGSGTSDSGKITWHGDLQQLKRELAQLMDLEQVQLAGTLSGEMQWKIPTGNAITLTGSAVLQQLAFQRPGSRRWQESQLHLTASASGTMNGSRIQELSQGEVSVRTPTDQLQLTLLSPVRPLDESVRWPLQLRVLGGWSSWLARVQPFISLPPVSVQGALDLNVTAEVNDQAITLSKATFQSQPLQFESPSLCVNEPLVKLEAAGSWDRHTGMVKVGNLVLQSTAVALRAQHVAALWGAADRNLSGEISARANLESLTTLWRWSGRQPAPWRLRGQAQCTASLADQAGVMSAKWKATLQDCQLQRARSITDQQPRVTAASATEDWLTMAREPNIQFAGSAHFDPGQGVLAMEHLELRTADEQIVTAQGTVRDAFGACVADLTGQATYDLEALLQRARPFLGDSIRAIGRDTQTFSLQGPLRISRGPSDASEAALAAAYQPLVSPELAGRCGFSWTAADLLGIAVGSGKLQPQLNRGTIETGRIEFPLSKGQFRLEPRFYLNQHPPIMTIEPGRVLDAVEISENMCAGWLKFVTPLVAEATRAKGVFSLTLESTTVPLLRPSDASVRGELHLQQAVMGPGPLAVSLLKAVEAVEAMIKASSSANAPSVGPDQFGAFTELLGRAAGLPGQPPPSNSLDASTSRYQLHIPEQYVPFRVAERRVYHDQFHVVVGNVTIVTQGSVGLDQSLQLVASVPVLRQWVGDERLWRVLQNKSVEIPVTGTIRNPRIDTQRVQQSLRKLVGDLLRDASGRMLERELQRGLNELFRQ